MCNINYAELYARLLSHLRHDLIGTQFLTPNSDLQGVSIIDCGLLSMGRNFLGGKGVEADACGLHGNLIFDHQFNFPGSRSKVLTTGDLPIIERAFISHASCCQLQQEIGARGLDVRFNTCHTSLPEEKSSRARDFASILTVGASDFTIFTVLERLSTLGLNCDSISTKAPSNNSVRSLGGKSDDIYMPEFFSNPSLNCDLAHVSRASDVASFHVEKCTVDRGILIEPTLIVPESKRSSGDFNNESDNNILSLAL